MSAVIVCMINNQDATVKILTYIVGVYRVPYAPLVVVVIKQNNVSNKHFILFYYNDWIFTSFSQ